MRLKILCNAIALFVRIGYMSDQDPEKIDLIEFKYHAVSNRSQRIETVRSSRRGNELPPHITPHTESPGTTYPAGGSVVRSYRCDK